MQKTKVLFQKLDPEAVIPKYSKIGDAGADISTIESFELMPGERKLVKTGIAIALQEGFVALIHPRSGLAAKNGITVVNAPGTVDSGYRGEIMVCLLNTDKEKSVKFEKGDRIAQIVIQEFVVADFQEVSTLPGSERGEDGFGSTGI